MDTIVILGLCALVWYGAKAALWAMVWIAEQGEPPHKGRADWH